MQEVIYDILGTFLGALLGIPAGIALNHAWSKRVDKTRRWQLRSALRDTVDRNAYLVGQIEKSINKPGCISFLNVDLTLLESTSTLKYEVLDDIELCKQIDVLRYELVHFSRKVDLLLDLEVDPSARLATSAPAGSMYNLLHPKLAEAINVHIKPVKEMITSLQEKLS